jgi:hypothetical protein
MPWLVRTISMFERYSYCLAAHEGSSFKAERVLREVQEASVRVKGTMWPGSGAS